MCARVLVGTDNSADCCVLLDVTTRAPRRRKYSSTSLSTSGGHASRGPVEQDGPRNVILQSRPARPLRVVWRATAEDVRHACIQDWRGASFCGWSGEPRCYQHGQVIAKAASGAPFSPHSSTKYIAIYRIVASSRILLGFRCAVLEGSD